MKTYDYLGREGLQQPNSIFTILFALMQEIKCSRFYSKSFRDRNWNDCVVRTLTLEKVKVTKFRWLKIVSLFFNYTNRAHEHGYKRPIWVHHISPAITLEVGQKKELWTIWVIMKKFQMELYNWSRSMWKNMVQKLFWVNLTWFPFYCHSARKTCTQNYLRNRVKIFRVYFLP